MTNSFRIPDSSWVRSAMLAKAEMSEVRDRTATVFSTADLKFTNTDLGGNFCINPLPQFTRSADIKRRGRSAYGIGMGRYYSETYDDHYQIIHIRFGVAVFNSLAAFIGHFYNPGVGALARTGRGPSSLYRLGQIGGMAISLMSWKLVAVRAIGYVFDIFASKTLSKFYELKPAMPLYWNAVQTMVNQLAVNLGIVPRALGSPAIGHPDFKYEFDQASVNRMREMAPRIITESGNIDVFAVANRAQRQARNQMKAAEVQFSSGSVQNNFAAALEALGSRTVVDENPQANFAAYRDRWTSTKPGSWDSEADPSNHADLVEDHALLKKKDEPVSSFFEAELDDGSAFASFRVNYSGAVSESFSNSVGESEIAAKMNSVASASRSTTFSLAGGNIAAGVGEIVKGVKDVITGIASGLGLDGPMGLLMGGANVDIPLMWKGSSATLPRVNYTMHLVIPYNNPFMQLMYMHIPLCMILAGVLPLSTGRQSYTSPFLLEYYDQGRAQTRLGMMDSVSVTRGGTTNLGFNSENRAMSIEVSFTIADMSNVMTMPIAQGVGFASQVLDGNILRGFWDDDNSFTDYMAILSSMGLADQIYTMRKLKLALTRQMVRWESWTSPARFMNWLGDTPPARLIGAFYAGAPM